MAQRELELLSFTLGRPGDGETVETVAPRIATVAYVLTPAGTVDVLVTFHQAGARRAIARWLGRHVWRGYFQRVQHTDGPCGARRRGS